MWVWRGLGGGDRQADQTQREFAGHRESVFAVGDALHLFRHPLSRGLWPDQVGQQCWDEISELLHVWQYIGHARFHVYGVCGCLACAVFGAYIGIARAGMGICMISRLWVGRR
jgi:hypothetical protein